MTMYHFIVFLPVAGALIAGLFGRVIGARASEIVTTAFLMIAAGLSWIAFFDVGYFGKDLRVPLFTWISAGDLKVEWALRIDTLTAVMLIVVNSVSALVHLYSIGYMHEDPHRPRFFAYLSLFTFAMLALVTADNLVQLFFGWEGVGLASYLLIGFWYQKPEANAAAIKAFVVNRVGDFGFALGIFAVFAMVGAVGFETVFAEAKSLTGKTIHIFGGNFDALTVICLLLFVGAMGVGAYSVGMFHLFTHAAFKALLFLGAGSVIHAMHHEQDMRNMGGLWKKIPFTYAMMVVGTIALTGFPFTAGYYSKDAIIEAAYAGHNAFAAYAFYITVIAAALTSFYSWRLIFLTFHGKTRADHHTYDHAHESPLTMTVPLALLAVGALVLGFGFKGGFLYEEGVKAFFRGSLFSHDNWHILHAMHEVPGWVPWLPTVMMAGGFAVSYWFYIARPDIPAALAKSQDVLYRFLLNKWYFDEIYDFVFVRPAKWIGRFLWKKGDGWLIDGFGPDGVSARVLDVTRNVVRLQTGYLYHYAFVMLIGVAALITWFLFRGAA